MQKIKLGISGISGKMGKNVLDLASQMDQFEIVAGLSSSTETFKNIKCYNNVNEFLSKIDLCIDFSSTDNLINILNTTIKNPPILVSGTTGLSVAEMQLFKDYSVQAKVFWAANFSIGIAILNQILEKTLPLINNKGFDIELLERHHKLKKDAPSGTLYSILETIAKCKDKSVAEIAHFNDQNSPLRPSGKIGVSFQRGGGIIGEHEISLINTFEEITLKHNAFDRKVFAQGAISASLWILDQVNGFYTMQNILN